MFQPNPPFRPDPFIGRPGLPGPGEFQYTFDIRLSMFNIVCTLGTEFLLPDRARPAPGPAPTSAPDERNNLVDGEGDGEGARTFFPESWIWAIQKTE